MSISSVDSGPLHVKPEVDLNLTTEANRVLHVLNEVIARTKIVGLMKQFSNDDAELLRDILDANTHFNFIEVCEKYNVTSVRRSSSSYSNESIDNQNQKTSQQLSTISSRFTETSESSTSYSSTERSEGFSKVKYRNDAALTEIIYKLEENPKVRQLAASMENQLPPPMKSFIHRMNEFKKRMEVRLNENAVQYKTREKYMRETYEKNVKAKKEISRLEEELLVTKTDANVCLIGRNILIKRHQNKIEKIQHNSQEAIEKRVNESEKSMVNSWKNSVIKQEKLKEDLLQASDKYTNLLKEHLATEKALRAKRTKVENQVLGWIQKFDQDIGEKQAEEEEIQALLDKETEELNEIQKKIEEQEEEYDELMQEKAEYEEEMLERRLYHFVINRSARRIQRTYRLYKARKLAKKLAKKGKKGKKKG